MNINDYIITYAYCGKTYLSNEFIAEISNRLEFYKHHPIIFHVNYPDFLNAEFKIKTVFCGFELTYMEWSKDHLVDKFATLEDILIYLDSKDFVNLLVAPKPLVPIGSIVFGCKVISYNEGYTKWRAYNFKDEPVLGVSEKNLNLKSNTEVKVNCYDHI